MNVKKLSSRAILLNRYYRITHFYSFLKQLLTRAAVVIGLVVALIIFLEYYVLDFEAILNHIVTTFSPPLIYSSFLVSETFFGLLPPEIFIAWSAKTSSPWLILLVLASLSYAGGIFSFLLGNYFSKNQKIKDYLEKKVADHIKKIKQWGALFIVLGATTPLPHSIVSMAAGLINYNFRHYLLFALTRFIRFAIYGWLIFESLV